MSKDFEQIALNQAETLNKQAQHIQQLIRDVNAAKEETRAALVLAGKYALKASVVADEESVRRAAAEDAYWFARLEREKNALEMFQDEVIRNVMINYLQKFENSGLTADQVRHVIKHIKAANDGCRRHAEQGQTYHEAISGIPASKPAPKRKARPVETYELPIFEDAS